MDRFHAGLWREPERIASLSEDTTDVALCYLVGLACQPTNITLIQFGRRALARVPRVWLRERIQQVAEQTLDLTDEWECRRLLELYCCLDDTLARQFAICCTESADPEVAEAGQDFLDDPHSFRETATIGLDQQVP